MTETTDVLVIGGGVFGLWAARALARAGATVVLAEAGRVGCGASSTPVGALTPHRPTHWRPFQEFQLQALLSLPAVAEGLLSETGLHIGYRRTGRLVPLLDEGARTRALANAEASKERWPAGLQMEVSDEVPDAFRDWLPGQAAPHGVTYDGLSAHVSARSYLAALAASLSSAADIREGWSLQRLAAPGVAEFHNARIAAGTIVLAGGWRALDHLDDVPGALAMRGVKGQAALFEASAPPDMPVLQTDGLYVTRQGETQVAVGSTSESTWSSPDPDDALEALIERARTAIPALRSAAVISRWSGIRPRAPGREPMIGPLPSQPSVLVATGGYKIGLAIAHLAGSAIASFVQRGDAPDLPLEFLPASRLEETTQR